MIRCDYVHTKLLRCCCRCRHHCRCYFVFFNTIKVVYIATRTHTKNTIRFCILSKWKKSCPIHCVTFGQSCTYNMLWIYTSSWFLFPFVWSLKFAQWTRSSRVSFSFVRAMFCVCMSSIKKTFIHNIHDFVLCSSNQSSVTNNAVVNSSNIKTKFILSFSICINCHIISNIL